MSDRGGPIVVGVDIGGTKMGAGLVASDGALLDHLERRTPTESQAALLAGLEEAVQSLVDRSPVAAIGVGVPSRVDQVAHRVVGSVHIPLEGIDLAGHLSSHFRLPAAVDNDANVATVAEWQLGAGRGTSDMVMLTLGTGIGGGLILGSRPYRGTRGAGVELGHMVVDADGPPCGGSCPGNGHFETYVSGRAADLKARELGLADGHALVAAAGSGNGAAVAALARLGRLLGAGLVTIVNVFEPELIVVGGGFGAAAGELVLAPARAVVAEQALQPGRDAVRVVHAELGPEAGVVGAGLLALEALDPGT